MGTIHDANLFKNNLCINGVINIYEPKLYSVACSINKILLLSQSPLAQMNIFRQKKILFPLFFNSCPKSTLLNIEL